MQNHHLRFRTLICQALNDRLLPELIHYIGDQPPRVVKLYEPWAPMRAPQPCQLLEKAVQPLSQLDLHLQLDYEVKNLPLPTD
mmetsp:Transcript_29933/g.70407  ORF Transcript_29933/g.70407 Transcript_29933/m.70407 type:complete len:83 (+) Transcript_29933:1254-1502(+)